MTLSSRVRDGLAMGGLAAVTVIVLGPAVSGAGIYYGDDVIIQNYPLRQFFADSWREGRMPYWCPEVFAGMPLFAEGQAGPLYPFNWLLFGLLAVPTAYTWSLALHYFLAGTLMYALLRRWQASRAGALLGGLTFAFSGFFVGHLIHLNLICAAAWLPGFLWCLEDLLTGRWWRGVGGGSLVLALQVFAGHPQITLYTVFFGGLYLLWNACLRFDYSTSSPLRCNPPIATSGQLPHRSPDAASTSPPGSNHSASSAMQDETTEFAPPLLSLGQVAGAYGLLVAAGLMLSAAQTLPFVELARSSARAVQTNRLFAPPVALSTLAAPYALGRPFTPAYRGPAFPWEFCAYVGVVPLFLALVAIGWGLPRRDWLWVGVGLAALGLTWNFPPLLVRGVHSLPGLNRALVPARALLLFSLAGAVLAAKGLDRLRQSAGSNVSWPRFWLAGGAFVLLSTAVLVPAWRSGALVFPEMTPLAIFGLWGLVGGSLLWVGKSRWSFPAVILLVLGVALDLTWFGLRFNPLCQPEALRQPRDTVEYLLTDQSWFRIACVPSPEVTDPLRLLRPNTNLLVGLPSVQGYSSFRALRYDRLCPHSLRLELPPRGALDVLGVKYVIAPPNWQREGFVRAASFDRVAVFRNRRCGPRAWLAEQARFVSGAEALETVAQGQTDVWRTVLLENTPLLPAAPLGDTASHRSSAILYPKGSKVEKGKVQWERVSPNLLRLTVHPRRPSLLVLAEVFAPGWQAYVDGEPAPIYPANYLLRAVPVPAGQHCVTFAYQPISVRGGIFLTLLAWCGWVASGLAHWVMRRPTFAPRSPSPRGRGEGWEGEEPPYPGAGETVPSATMEVSVVIPAYNEVERIGQTLTATLAYLQQTNWTFEIVVVDDGSDDGTAATVQALSSPSVRLLRHVPNRGKGYSVREGVLAARGKTVLFMDADLSFAPETIGQFVTHLHTSGADLVIGDRNAGGLNAYRRLPLSRRIAGRVFTWLVEALCVPGIADTQCGLKAFRREVAWRLFPRLTIERWGFDVELLFLARCFGYRIERLPVQTIYVGGSKVRLLWDSLAMFANLFQIRWNHWRGRYDGAGEAESQISNYPRGSSSPREGKIGRQNGPKATCGGRGLREAGGESSPGT